MSTAAQLLGAIIETPDEDTPRLVYADYLEENDQPERAEFIRAQCEYARLPPWDARAKSLLQCTRVLLARRGREWCDALPRLEGIAWGEFARGFVSRVSVTSAKALRTHASAIQAVAPVDHATIPMSEARDVENRCELPWLRGLCLTDAEEFDAARFSRLLESGIADHLRTLDLSGAGIENGGAEIIAESSRLANLRELDLSECYVGVAGAEALAASRHLAGLRVLRFTSTGSGYVDDPFLRAEGVRALAARESHLKNLRTLELGGQGTLDADAVRTLLTSPAFANLETVALNNCDLPADAFDADPGPARWKQLNVSGNRLTPDSVREMGLLPQFQSLARLQAGWCRLDDEGLLALGRTIFAPGLCELYVPRNGFGADGAEALARGNWQSLHTLDLLHNQIDAAGAGHLARGNFPALADLRLTSNAIGDDGAAAIAAAPWAGSLRRLNLKGATIGLEGVKALAASPLLRNLARLNLSQQHASSRTTPGGILIGSDGARAIAGGTWEGLTDLDLHDAKIGDEGAAALASAPFLKHLITLDVGGNDLTARGLQRLLGDEFPALLELNLGSNKRFGAEGLKAFDDAGRFPVLVSLGLLYCDLPAVALEAFADSELCSRLSRLQYHGNQVSQEVHRRLQPLNWAAYGPTWVDEERVHETDW